MNSSSLLSITLWNTVNMVNLKKEMIRDRLVVGIRDSSLSERLQMDDALTLEKANKLVRQRDAVKEQQSFLKKEQCS